MSSLTNLPPKVLESLKMFEGVVKPNSSYKIPDSREIKTIVVPLEVDLPELSDDDFSEFRKWFKMFEKIAHQKSLTRGEIISLLLHHVPDHRNMDVSNILEKSEIATIQDIQIRLALEFFEDRLEYIVTMSGGHIEQGSTITEIVKDFISKCDDLYLVSLALQIECPVSKMTLLCTLLEALPTSVVEKLFNKYPVLKEESFNTIIHTLLKAPIPFPKKEKVVGNVYAVDTPTSRFSKKKKERLPPRCHCCGERTHLKRDCPHKNKYCNKCKQKGHLEIMCKNQLVIGKEEKPVGVMQQTLKKIHLHLDQDNTERKKIEENIALEKHRLEQKDKHNEYQRKAYHERKAEEKALQIQRKNKPYEIIDVELANERGYKSQKQEESPAVSSIDVVLDVEEVDEFGYLDIEVNGNKIRGLLDTGAKVCAITTDMFKQLNLKRDQNLGDVLLKTAGGLVDAFVTEEVEIKSLDNGKKFKTKCYVSDKNNVPEFIISREAMKELGYLLVYLKEKGVYAIQSAPPKEDEVNQELDPSLLEILNNCEIEDVKEKEKFKNLLLEFQKVWDEIPFFINDKLSTKIKVNGEPKRIKHRPMSPEILELVHRKVDEMVKQGVITKVEASEWLSPIVLVPKPDGTWRLTIDYRRLNKFVVDDVYPLPHMRDLMKIFHGKRWFSKIDLKDGFWNISLSEESKEYTAFYVPRRGIFVFNVLPFGLKTSPTIFQGMMENIFMDLIKEEKVTIYIDDLIILSETVEEHLETLRRVFELIKKYDLRVNPKKCELFKRSVTYLGQVINEKGMRPSPDKIQGVLDMKQPTNKKELRGFIGLVNYFSNHVKGLAELLVPLTPLTSKKRKFIWTEEHTKAFKEIKKAIIHITYLSFPDSDKPFILYTDASDVAVGAVLMQEDSVTGKTKYLHFLSRKLSEGQQKWSTIEKELYAIVVACKALDYYIKGSKVIVRTECKGLIGSEDDFRGKLYRWKLFLTEYNLEFEHINGSYNNIADWLSRSVGDGDDIEIPEVFYISLNEEKKLESDPSIPTLNNIITAAELEIRELPDEVIWVDGIPIHARLKNLYIPKVYRQDILFWFHSSKYGGHSGINKTLKKIKKHFWWPSMSKDVENYIGECVICQIMRTRKSVPDRSGKLSRRYGLFDLISLDVVGPRKWEGKDYYIHVAMDHYSRYMFTEVLEHSPTSAEVILFVKKWIKSYGCPRAILTDQASIYTSKEFHDYVQNKLKIRLVHTSTYYPQGNGINESSHKSLEYIIKTMDKMDEEETYPELVDRAVLVYNCSPHGSIGDTPYFTVFGIDCLVPGLMEFTSTIEPTLRMLYLRDRWVDFQKEKEKGKLDKTLKEHKLKVGELITYELSDSERKKIQHHSGCPQYLPHWSLPYRVTEIKNETIKAIPVYFRGNEIQFPMSKVRVLNIKNRDSYRKQIDKLLRVGQDYKRKRKEEVKSKMFKSTKKFHKNKLAEDEDNLSE